MAITGKEFDKQFGELLARIQKDVTPFPNDTTAKKIARKKRASSDPFFFALTYFPHYIQVKEEYRDAWKTPEMEIDWVEAGFASVHPEFFKAANLFGALSIVAGFRESAKDTLLGLIDPIFKLVTDDKDRMRWFTACMAMTHDKAEGKVIPIKLELEKNVRLRSDFGELVGNTKWEQDHFVLSNGRGVKAYGRDEAMRGENIFGHRPDHIILNDINDPTKPDSSALVQKFLDSVRGDILFAVNSTRWSAIYLCNHTVKGDIVDELLTGKHTSHFNKHIFRALIPNDLETKRDRDIARECREAGFLDGMKSSWEYRHPTLKLLQEQKNDPDTFACERMQIPRNRKDQKFKDNYFRFHTKEELVGKVYTVYTAVDPSAKDAADYKAVVSVGVGIRNDSLHIPVRRVSIQQQPIDDMLAETFRHRQALRSKIVGVETNGFQILLKREYIRLQKKYGLLPFHELEHKGESKESRIERIVPFVKEGIITFDLDDPDQDLLIRQLKAFPNAGQVSAGGLGDDGPDALAMCIELIEQFPHAGEVHYTSIRKREAQFAGGAYG